MRENCSYGTKIPLLVNKNTMKALGYLVSTQVFGTRAAPTLPGLKIPVWCHSWFVYSLVSWVKCLAWKITGQFLKSETFEWTLSSFHFIYNLTVSAVHNVITRWSALRHMHEKPAWETDYCDLKPFTEALRLMSRSCLQTSHLAPQRTAEWGSEMEQPSRISHVPSELKYKP